MGSTAIMEDSTRHRRKPPPVVQVPSGDSQDDPKPRRRKRKRNDEAPFFVLVAQVGATLFLICLVTFYLYRRVYPYDPNAGMVEEIVYVVDDTPNEDRAPNLNIEGKSEDYTAEDEAKLALLMKQQKKAMMEQEIAAVVLETEPPLPVFELSEAAQWDAYGILAKIPLNDTSMFGQVAKGLRERFAERYGNENIARMLLDKGMTTYGNDDVSATACRLHRAREEKRPFRVAFGGYSVTAGRGNQFEQSFPFQLQRVLETAFKVSGIPELHVRNAAIGGCPAFPYGWCMTNFWGTEPDVVSWDYSMNEAGGLPEGLEAYVRHLLSTYSTIPPKLIVKDTYLAAARRDVLGAYAKLLKDPLVLHTGPAVKPFLERKDEHNPIGFQEWRKFGAPIGAPGQALHHPALKEHELLGWMLAMHFLTALEYLHATPDLVCMWEPTGSLPNPVTGANTTSYEGTLFGHPKGNDWQMNHMYCRTTFQPIVNGDLSEVVVSGTTGEDLDVTLPKSQMYYNEGWTFDLSEEEKQTKRKLSLYQNGLGFVDSKEAYYGIYESPRMQLLLPYETNGTTGPQVGQSAAEWFESIIVCQVNEKRDATACNMGSDLGITVGGINATASMMKDTGTLYLGKPVCLKVSIPFNATLTSHNELASTSQRLEDDQIGVLMEIQVTNPHIAHVHQACSVSHVIWEQREIESSSQKQITTSQV